MKYKYLLVTLASVILIGILYFFYVVKSDGCKWKPNGTPCTFGLWQDKNGEICGGQSCVGLGEGVCVKGECED